MPAYYCHSASCYCCWPHDVILLCFLTHAALPHLHSKRGPSQLVFCLQAVPAPSVEGGQALSSIAEQLQSQGDSKQQMQLLLEYARRLPHLPEEQRSYANRVMGCTSQVLPEEWSYAVRIAIVSQATCSMSCVLLQ